MTIEWNRVTWYSKLLAVIIFVGTFALAFSLGREYETLQNIDGIVSPEVGIPSQDDSTDFLFGVGETRSFGADSKITFDSVTQDSRCPKDVQCIWAGTVKAKLIAVSGNTREEAIIELSKNPVELGGHLVSLISVIPEKTASQIDSTKYHLLFHITK